MTTVWRDWASYRRFQKLPAPARRVAFYSETQQDWHHLQPPIDFLIGSWVHVASLPRYAGHHGRAAGRTRRGHGKARTEGGAGSQVATSSQIGPPSTT